MHLSDFSTLLLLLLPSLLLLRRLILFLVSDCDLPTYTARVSRSHFQGKVAWITGASSGIGAALARRLAKEGALLILTARREDELESVADSLPCGRGNVHVLALDITDLHAVERNAEEIADIFGRLDFVFNNAGVATRATASDLDLEYVDKVMKLNFTAPVALARACLPALRAAPGGCGTIVNTSSIAALVQTPLRSSYCASKAALCAYFDCLRLEEDDVRVVNVYPGSVRTPICFNAVTNNGKPYGKSDPNVENGLSADRVADRMLAAISAGVDHSWIARRGELMAVRISQVFPIVWHIYAKGRADAYRARLQQA